MPSSWRTGRAALVSALPGKAKLTAYVTPAQLPDTWKDGPRLLQKVVEEIGKETGQDAGKVTFVKLLGVASAQALADQLLSFAVEALEPLGKKADPLRDLVHFVRHRKR